ncbi:MAG: hypothetical protein WC423_00810 [Vulcanimicrobiota bacterium]
MLIAHSRHTGFAKFPLPKQLAPSGLKPAMDQFEKAELESWSERLRPDLGYLTTPPAGPVEGKFEQAQGYLIDLIDRLALEDLNKRKLDFQVEIFTGDVPQAALDDDMSAEASWKEEHPGKEWPVRAWFGTPTGSHKPIYRLAVNLGMLNTLESRDELAFVLSHQLETLLDHDRKDPYNEELLSPANQSFVDPRSFQAEADKAAIARMTRAGFNPRAALSALNKLFSKAPVEYPSEDLNRGLVAAAHGQEHQGMRVGLVQAEVESYVRRRHPATSKPPEPLPDLVRLEVAPNYRKPVKDRASFARDHQVLALKLSGPETPAWMFAQGVPPKELGTIALAGGTVADKEHALLAAVSHLGENTALTPQNRIDGFLRLLLSTEGETMPGRFGEESSGKVHRFLSENASGWNPNTFMNSLQRGQSSLHRRFVNGVVFNENFQRMAQDALPGLVQQVPSAWIKSSDQSRQELEELTGLIRENHTSGRNEWPLGRAVDQATLSFIERLDAEALARESGEHGAPRAISLSNALLGLSEPTPEFQLELRESAQGLLKAGAEVREDHIRLRLRPPYGEPHKLHGYLNEMGQSETWQSFSREFDSDFQALLKDYVSVSVGQPGFSASSERTTAYPQKLEERLVKLLESEEKDQALTHLVRNLQPDRRVQGHSPRRAWLGQAAAAQAKSPQLWNQLVRPDRSQHSELLSKTLTEGYRLKPEDLPDTSTEHLMALAQRVETGEFKPRREDYQSDSAWQQALDEYHQRQAKIDEVLQPVAPLESRLVLGRMALLGHHSGISEEVTRGLSKERFVRLLGSAEEAVQRAEALAELGGSGSTEQVGSDAGAFLVDGFLAIQDQLESVEQWYDLATRTIDFSHGGLQARVGSKKAMGQNLFTRLDQVAEPKLAGWLAKDQVMDILSASQASDLLLKSMGESTAPGASPEALARKVELLDQQYELREKHPVVFTSLRDKITDRAQLQPSTVDLVFPKQERGVTDTNQAYSNRARALSGLLAVARQRSPQEQIDTVEYLMGRRELMPEYLEKASESQAFAPLTTSLENTRQELLEADTQTRVMVANSFLAGPSGILRTEKGREAVIDHFLKNLNPGNRELGNKIARAVLSSHGEADTLAVAFILGQNPGEDKDGPKKTRLDEATILNRLFDAYGVPGIKMKQYLAFTSEFEDFKEAFENAQDAAMPLNYYQVLKLVQARFGEEWPADLKIDRVLGSGSVNVAIRYRDEKTGQREVVSLGREDIEESTQYDFERFHKFIQELTRTPEDREKFGYVLGLLNLIEASVELEFEKEQAMAVQKMAYRTYQHQASGWTVKSIDAYRVENLGLFMEEAKGRTARKIYNEDPDTYNSAMEAMSAAEFGVLKGQTADKNWRPKPLFANPDFHDGQVMIDKDNKTVTILDFGQAVPIDNEERAAALDLLTIIGKADSPKAAARRLNKRYFNKEKVMTPQELVPILERKDRMDCFIHLLSAISQNGAEVPLSSVHWVLGLNRQMALTEKIGKPIAKQVRNMVIAHKLKAPLGVYNAAHESKEAVLKVAEVAADTAMAVGVGLINWVGGWFGWKLPKHEVDRSHQTQTRGSVVPLQPAFPQGHVQDGKSY